MNNLTEILRQELAVLDEAHEYKPDAISEIFTQVMKLAPPLLESTERILNYSVRYFNAGE